MTQTKYTKGTWELRGNKVFIEGTTNSVAQIHVQKNYNDSTFEAIEDIEANANAKLVVQSPTMLEELKTNYDFLLALYSSINNPSFNKDEAQQIMLDRMEKQLELVKKATT